MTEPVLVDFILALLWAPLLLACTYLLLLTLLSGALPAPPRSRRELHFDIIVPAHNEAAGLRATLDSLAALDWPAARLRRIVVADNCEDETAAVARAAGACVLERRNPAQRGKGYALDHAFRQCLADAVADALVVVDADSLASPNLLEAFASRIEGGAACVQAYYGVRNPHDSWRTRLLTIAHGAFHVVRSRARERLGLSCGLRGNGWCITVAALRAVPYRAFSVTEDLEYGIALGRAGHRVAYAHEASVDGQMESDGAVAGRQRQRWEGGRFGLARRTALPLLIDGLRRRDRIVLDLAADLLVPPLSTLALGVFLLGALSGAAMAVGAAAAWMSVGAGCALSLTAYVLRGWRLSGIGLRGLVDLLQVPRFLLWKLALIQRSGAQEWVPTRRRHP